MIALVISGLFALYSWEANQINREGNELTGRVIAQGAEGVKTNKQALEENIAKKECEDLDSRLQEARDLVSNQIANNISVPKINLEIIHNASGLKIKGECKKALNLFENEFILIQYNYNAITGGVIGAEYSKKSTSFIGLTFIFVLIMMICLISLKKKFKK